MEYSSTAALWSEYVIDGLRREISPGRMLQALCCGSDGTTSPSVPAGSAYPAQIMDESIDPEPVEGNFYRSKVHGYIEAIKALKTISMPAAYSAGRTRLALSGALLDALWIRGSFTLEDLGISANWEWNGAGVGDMAAFYASVEAAADFADALGLQFSTFSYTPGRSRTVHFGISTMGQTLSKGRLCPESARANPKDWIIYIPFDTSEYRLGGSLLSSATGIPGGKAAEPIDADYFMDCFEVVRELIEDGLVKAGATVAGGGMAMALERMFPKDCGITAELGDIAAASGEGDIVKILFGEVPGVLIQIEDKDYDYVDAELLLQDVAYYPIGSPKPGKPGIKTMVSTNSGVSGILRTLLESTASEGED